MPLFLSQRQPDLVEQMDREDCDPIKLDNTYKQFTVINVLLSNWRKVYKKYLRPKMSEAGKTYTLLDIGFGGGDIPLALSKWARKDGIDLKITAIEADHRALSYVIEKPADPKVNFRFCLSSEMVEMNEQFDFVISNHVLHHLDGQAFRQVLDDARALSKKMVLFNDIERSDIGYALFTTLTRPLFFNSFIIEDGLTSIKKSYTKKELVEQASPGWRVERSFPFRLLLMYE